MVLQGPLHLEDVGAALQPGWQLELLVQVWLVLQDLWGRRAIPQPELQQPAVRLDFASLPFPNWKWLLARGSWLFPLLAEMGTSAPVGAVLCVRALSCVGVEHHPLSNTRTTHWIYFPAQHMEGASAREPPTSTRCATRRSARGPTRISVPSSASSATPTTPTRTANIPGFPTSITTVSGGRS